MTHKLYKIKDNKIERTRKTCPRCGDGVFLGDHKDRYACGKCGYSELKKSQKPPEENREDAKK